MNTENITDLKINKRFEKFDIGIKRQINAITATSLEHGRIFMPIFVWDQTNEVVLSYSLVQLAIEYPELKYTIIRLPFKDWQEAEACVVDYQVAQPYLSLWDKLEITLSCDEYWYQKQLAKQNQGTRTDLSSEPDEKLRSQEVNRIVAEKVGCKPTIVYNFRAIYFSGRNEIIEKCRNGLAISTAYEMLKGNIKKPSPKPNDPQSQLEILPCDVFTECERNFDIGKKNINRVNGFVPDPAVCIQKMQKAKIPDGRIWLVFHKDLGVVQVMKKTIDKEKGKITVKVDSFNCQIKEAADAMYIMEADHINSGPTEHNRKDESDFDNTLQGERDEI